MHIVVCHNRLMPKGGIENRGAMPSADKPLAGTPPPPRADEEIAKMPMPPAGWVENDQKRNTVLSMLRDAVKKERHVTRIDLAKAIGMSESTVANSERMWTGIKPKNKASQPALIRVLEYYEWAVQNREAAEAAYRRLVPREASRFRKQGEPEKPKPRFSALSKKQITIGKALLGEFKRRMASGAPFRKITDMRFIKEVCEIAGVAPSTYTELVGEAGGPDHLMKLVDDERKKGTIF